MYMERKIGKRDFWFSILVEKQRWTNLDILVVFTTHMLLRNIDGREKMSFLKYIDLQEKLQMKY